MSDEMPDDEVIEKLQRLVAEGKATREVTVLPNGDLEVRWTFHAEVNSDHPCYVGKLVL